MTPFRKIKNIYNRRDVHWYRIRSKLGTMLEGFLSEVSDKKEVSKYLLSHRMVAFPYKFAEDYLNFSAIIYRKEKYPYVIHKDKKLYMPIEWSDNEICDYYRSLLVEQDIESPHKYLSKEERFPQEDSIVADIGGAEGIFSLEIIDKIKKVYIFESDYKWLEPLNRTFRPWKEKVEIVPKFVGDHDDHNTVKLDTFFQNKQIDYLKEDIEGSEYKMLKGGAETFSTKIKQALMCVYHLPNDETMIRNYMYGYGFDYMDVNPKYILFHYVKDTFKHPYIRHGVLYCEKRSLYSDVLE